MFCRYCGKELDDRAVICPGCGIPVNGYNALNLQAPAPVAMVSDRRINGIGIAAFVVSILSLYFGAFFAIVPLAALGLAIAAFSMRKNYNSCNGLAVAGFVVSIVSSAVWVLFWMITFGILIFD